MNKKIFFARAASKALTLAAAAMMMSAAFTACSKDSDNDNGGGTPEPEPKAQTVTLDGVENSIVKAEYEDEGNGNYFLYLNLSADGKEGVAIQLNKDLHITGSPIKLTEKEKKHDGKWYWSIEYNKSAGTRLINTSGEPGRAEPVFTTGTLTVSGSLDGTLNIKLENGRVKGEDGKEHTLTVSYSGKMDKYVAPLPAPKAQTVTFDGVEKPILKAEYEDGGDGDYRLFLNLSADGKERVEIGLNKELHMTGSPIDLTEREKKHEGDEWYWAVDYYKPDDIQLIDTYAHPDSERPVFTTGTLTASGSPDGTINIRLKNGRVKGKDGKEHTLTISYSGKMDKYGAPLPAPKAQTVTIDGVEKSIVKAEYKDETGGEYRLYLYLSADGKEKVQFELNKDLHMTGSPINLTEREKKHGRKWYWWICYYRPDGTRPIATWGQPDELYEPGDTIYPVFTTGTLTASGSLTGTFTIKLENGRVKGTDGKEHTLVLSYSGKMTKKK
ncbi:MAG: hypothetical protein ACTTGW_01445 [Candidatus Cryptobacteroides sp.]